MNNSLPTKTVPAITVPTISEHWPLHTDPAAWPWSELDPLPPLLLADGGGEQARQQTTIRLCHDGQRLYAHFTCEDNDIWGTYTQRDDPIYDEEVVELFLAPDGETPTRYAEIEISPNGVLLDALIHNPTGDRADMTANFEWNCPGIEWQAGRDETQDRWWALLVIPLAGLLEDDVPSTELPTRWRANFYRIERPRNGEPEFSCWSPTQTEPADFHKPAQFGVLDLG